MKLLPILCLLSLSLRGAELPEPSPSQLPRWRGFNLLEKFRFEKGEHPYVEDDFKWISTWGFNFVRLPMDYRFWIKNGDWNQIDESELTDIDQALAWGQQYGIHVCLNFHRAPGYCVSPPKEPADLWTDPQALSACAKHWALFARRYKNIPNRYLSFNLVNEPGDISPQDYLRVATALVTAIRAEDPKRLIIADGRQWGRLPVPELGALHIAQSTRGYDPHQITHYQASWIPGSKTWPLPSWPSADFNLSRLESNYQPWTQLRSQNTGIHVGEWGVFHFTPHKVTLAFMRDMLQLYKRLGLGWALWNFRGGFGVMDSGRTDVAYEDFHGHKLDRKMLELLRKY